MEKTMSQTINSAFNRIDKNPWGSPVGGMRAPTERFSATRAYDKLIALSTVVLVAAIFGWLAVPRGIAIACIFVAFGLVLVSWFRMQWAKYLAPAYAVAEGVALGAISASYANIGHGIVPTAMVFTAAVFVTCLVLYRTGLVRVTPRFAAMAGMGAMGIIAVSVLSLFISIPGVNSFGAFGLVFGALCLGVAVLSLFTDFDYVRRSEALGVSAEGEWAAALAMLTALVLVYLSMLRILASAYGGGGRRR
jgi:uncharacterized YccA/Bax inhibitor family protein